MAPNLDPAVERLPVDERRTLQGQRLRDLVARLDAVDTPWWQGKLADVDATAIRSVDDLARLPFTVKAEFREQYPFGMLAVPLEDTVRVHASSGTSGKPTIVAYTAHDIELFAEVNARALRCAGALPQHVIHVAYGYGLFTGGLGLHYGVEALGATAVPAGGGNTAFQTTLLADLGATGLCATPSFAMLLAERAAADGVAGIGLRWGVFGAEPWSEGMRAKLESAWSAVTGAPFDACDIYGLSEVIGPGVAQEAPQSKGALFVFDDHFLPEIVDPDTGDPVADGSHGELVLTTLTKQAQPVLRYRTGDVTRFVDDHCPSGRTHRRIERLKGRVDDMLVIRGVNVFPKEIEAVLMDDAAVGAQYAVVIDERATLQRLEVRGELTSADDLTRLEAVQDRLERALASRLRLSVDVRLAGPGQMPRQETGKAQRVFRWAADQPDPYPVQAVSSA